MVTTDFDRYQEWSELSSALVVPTDRVECFDNHDQEGFMSGTLCSSNNHNGTPCCPFALTARLVIGMGFTRASEARRHIAVHFDEAVSFVLQAQY